MANNADWLNTLNYIDFLRDVGRHFSVNRMLSFDSVKLRLDRQQELSFLEFNYMILQAYDFVELHKRTGCVLQMGGSDQWGNIVNGIDLGRRMANAQLFALTSPLITTSSGAKMGKTAAGAVWLNADLVSPYDYWQFWRNTEDGDVARFLKLFTVLPLDEIGRLAALQGLGDQRSEEGARDRSDRAGARPRRRRRRPPTPRAAPSRKARSPKTCRPWKSRTPSSRQLGVLAAFVRAGLVTSNGDARRQIKGGGLKVNDATVTDEKMLLTPRAAHAGGRHQAFARPKAARAVEAGVGTAAAAARVTAAARRAAVAGVAEFEQLAQQARRDRRDRIDDRPRIARRAGHFVGDAEQALVAAAAEEQPDDRNLAEHVVEAVERHQRAAHAHLVARVVDQAFHGGADHRALDHAVADHGAARRAGEFGARLR